MTKCDCCDHPLQHAIRAVIARYEAPIPPPTAPQIIDELRNAVQQWENDQCPECNGSGEIFGEGVVSGDARAPCPRCHQLGEPKMTMRITIENADDSGRVVHVEQEDRLADQHEWQHSDKATLAKGEKRSWWIHAARRLIVTEQV